MIRKLKKKINRLYLYISYLKRRIKKTKSIYYDNCEEVKSVIKMPLAAYDWEKDYTIDKESTEREKRLPLQPEPLTGAERKQK